VCACAHSAQYWSLTSTTQTGSSSVALNGKRQRKPRICANVTPITHNIVDGMCILTDAKLTDKPSSSSECCCSEWILIGWSLAALCCYRPNTVVAEDHNSLPSPSVHLIPTDRLTFAVRLFSTAHSSTTSCCSFYWSTNFVSFHNWLRRTTHQPTDFGSRAASFKRPLFCQSTCLCLCVSVCPQIWR